VEKITVSDWKLADEIETREDVIGILEAALEEKDIEFLFKVIGDIAHSKGMTQIAQELNLNRENLCLSLSQGGNPSFNAVVNVLDNLGYGISIHQKKAS